MALPRIEQIGEWNPQFFREIKGRLVPRNIVIATAVSLVSQLILLISFSTQLPVPNDSATAISHRYCTGTAASEYALPICLTDGFKGFVINWSLWWKDVFVWLSIMGIFALLVVGTYMLIVDLAKEERRGTLNFLRLTPQSSPSILMGKMLGVPMLLYLVGFLALPLHLLAGLSGGISLSLILSYYVVLAASCWFFYSVALLLGLTGKWLGGFQAWLGSGVVLMLLFPMTIMLMNGSDATDSSFDWLMLFNPEMALPYLMGSYSLDASTTANYSSTLQQLTYFFVPVGSSIWSIVGLMVLNFGLWSYWIWQGVNRCFHNPTGTLLGKQQSYWLTACFEVVILGFAVNPEVGQGESYTQGAFENFQLILVFNLLLFLSLIAALSPQRQGMQDWIRYRHKQRSAHKRGVLLDLIWGERSPALVAIALNLAIASSILLPWILLWPNSELEIPTLFNIRALWGLLVSSSLTLLYAAVAQLMLLMKTPKRAVWAATSVGGLIVVPPMIFGFLWMTATNNPGVWLFSAFPGESLAYTTGFSVFLAVIGQSLTFGLLSLQLTRQLQKVGESDLKALLSECSSLKLR
jgi:hypothetical protein